MIPLGLGTDIIEIKRIELALATYGQRFLDKIFTASEQDYCKLYKQPAPQLAARFAAKEAAVKALGVGFRNGIGWLDIQIDRSDLGRPLLTLSSKLRAIYPNVQFMLSLSHCRAYATAVAFAFEQAY